MLHKALDEFRCYKDKDIEQFLRKKAVSYVQQEICTVYLLLNEEILKTQQKIFIEAYFTLSHKVIAFTPDVSLTTRKKVSISKNAEIGHFVLIGQLGKYMSLDKDNNVCVSSLSSATILNHAIDIIRFSKKIIVCRAVLVETKFEEKLYHLYEDYGFKPLQIKPSNQLRQFYLRLKSQ